MKSRLLLVALVALACTAAAAVVASAGVSHSPDRHHRSSYEVWLVDQEDKDSLGVGTLYVFDGRELTRDAGPRRSRGDQSRRRRGDHVQGQDRNGSPSPAHDRLQRRRRRRSRGQPLRRPGLRGQRARRLHRRGHTRAGGLHRRGHAGARRLADARPAAPDRRQPEREAAAAHQDQLQDRDVLARGQGDHQPQDLPDADQRSRARTRSCVRTTRRSAPAPPATAASPS